MQSNYFKITQMSANLGAFCYSVTWPVHGVVTNNRWRLLKWAFDTGAYQIALTDHKHQVLTIDYSLYLSTNVEDLTRYVMHDMPAVTGVAFETRQQAEHFVDSAEKHIMWRQLSRKETS